MGVALEKECMLTMAVAPKVREDDHNRSNKVLRQFIGRETVEREERKPGLEFDVIK